MMTHENPDDFVENDRWIEASQKRLTILRPKMEDAKHKFLEEAARILSIDSKELIKEAKKQFRNNYIREDEEHIRREEAQITTYEKPPEYLKNVEETAEAILAGHDIKPDPIDKDFFTVLNIVLTTKQEKASQKARADDAQNVMTEYDIMRTIRMLFENSDSSKKTSIEMLYEVWEEFWGNINVIRNEAQRRGIREEQLEVDAIQSGEADQLQEVAQFRYGMENGYLEPIGNGRYKVITSLHEYFSALKTCLPLNTDIFFGKLVKRKSGELYTENTIRREINYLKGGN